MEKECLIAEIKAYAEHIRTANDCLTVFKSICDAAKKYNEEVNLSPAFFQISRNATLYTYCMEVVKLFDNAGNTRSIQKLLNVAKANQNLFPRKIETCYQNASDPNGQIVEIEKTDIKAIIADLEKELDGLNSIITPLKGRRDKMWAHTDKVYFQNTDQISIDFPVTFADVEKLIRFAEKTCNKFLALLNGEVYFCQSGNADDLPVLLSHVKS